MVLQKQIKLDRGLYQGMNENHQKDVDVAEMLSTLELQRQTIASMRLVMDKQGLALDRYLNLTDRLRGMSLLDRLRFVFRGGL